MEPEAEYLTHHEKILLRRAQGGDRDALGSLLMKHERACYSFALRLTGTQSDAQDVCQDAFSRAVRDVGSWRRVGSFRSWLLSIVVCAHRDRLGSERARRHRERSHALERKVNRATGMSDVERRELRRNLDVSLGQLEEIYRLPIALRYEQGLNTAEAAAVLVIPEGTVKTNVRRGLEKLRELMTRKGYGAAALGGSAMEAALAQTPKASVPASLTTFIRSLVSGSVAAGKVTAGAGSAAAGSLALGWKLLAGISLATILGAGGFAGWKHLRPAAAAPQAADQRPPAAAAQAPGVVITPRTHHAWAAFAEIERKGGPSVAMLGGQGDVTLLVPAEIRFQEVEGRKFIEAVAATRDLKVAWVRDGKCAVLYARCPDIEVDRIGKKLASGNTATRREGAWLAGWQRDVRVVSLLVKAAKDADAEVARQAVVGLRRMGWVSVLMLDATGIELLAADLDSRDSNVRYQAASALGSVGGEKALALLEKALADKDKYVRSGAAFALGSVGGEKARDLLLARLAAEKERFVLVAVSGVLRTRFRGDPKVAQALKGFKLPSGPKSRPTPEPEPPEVF